MEADYAQQEALLEQYYWMEEVESYTNKFTVQALVLEAKEVLSEKQSFIQQNQFFRVRSVITHGIVTDQLTDKQKYILGDFILTNS